MTETIEAHATNETEDVQAWAERQAARYRHLLDWTAGEPARWAERKATLEATGYEFVYAYIDSEMWEDGRSSTPHRVVKKTVTRVYVEHRWFSTERDLVRDLTEGTFILDRAELEREGRATRRGRSWHEDYYTVPYEDTPAWHEQLANLRRSFEAMLTPESWLEHRRKVDEYMARPWGSGG